jgi:hypothetical protein
MWQALGIDNNMAIDTEDLFAGAITSAVCTVGVFDTLCINDAKTRSGVAPLPSTGLANLIFLMPAPADWCRLRVSRSTTRNNDVHTPSREIDQQHAPLAAALQQIQNGTEHLRQVHVEVGLSYGHFPAGF